MGGTFSDIVGGGPSAYQGPSTFPDKINLPPWAKSIPPDSPKTYFDISVDGEKIGRIEMVLAAAVVPKTVENFKQLCIGAKPDMTYKGEYNDDDNDDIYTYNYTKSQYIQYTYRFTISSYHS